MTIINSTLTPFNEFISLFLSNFNNILLESINENILQNEPKLSPMGNNMKYITMYIEEMHVHFDKSTDFTYKK